MKAANTFVSWELVSVVNIVHSPDTRDGKLHGNDAIVVPPTHLTRVRLLDCEHTRALYIMHGIVLMVMLAHLFQKEFSAPPARAHKAHFVKRW